MLEEKKNKRKKKSLSCIRKMATFVDNDKGMFSSPVSLLFFLGDSFLGRLTSLVLSYLTFPCSHPISPPRCDQCGQ
jgi:hypothetical protein